MSAKAMTFAQWEVAVLWQRVFAAEAEVRAQYLHPCARTIVHEYLSEMRDAAARRERDEVERLAQLIAWKLAVEREWYGEEPA